MLEPYDILGFNKELDLSVPGQTCGNISDWNVVNSTPKLLMDTVSNNGGCHVIPTECFKYLLRSYIRNGVSVL